ncbi:hypothetical protein L0F63_002212 [Massospora cicadina]|nr:hypothetical protein L0F63_002212 [Massospora cicadina]
MSSPQINLPKVKLTPQPPDSFKGFENVYHHPCPVHINIDLTATPKQLHSGVKEIVSFASHNNLRVSGQIDGPEIGGRAYPFEWYLSYHHDPGVEPGALNVKAFPTPGDVSFQVYIEYNRPIEVAERPRGANSRFRTSGAVGVKLAGLAPHPPPFIIGGEHPTLKRFAEGCWVSVQGAWPTARAGLRGAQAEPGGSDREGIEEMLNFSRRAQFETLCLMVDCSRNAVPAVPTLFKLLRFGALMGYNMLQLYTEDTYEIKGEPYFGFYRGGYTQAEMAAIDDYAFDLGIEVVPCIQTLGHLGQMLQWPHYSSLKDTNEVLLTRFNETYEFIEKMIVASSQPLRSKRIHLGMDEVREVSHSPQAYGLGEGRFRHFFGQEDNTKIFVDHLTRIKAICAKHRLKPMIWSDMLFCVGAKSMSLASYYDANSRPAAIHLDPGNEAELELVFWDYYHTSPDIYLQKLRNHRELGCASPWMAAGAWTWSRFWCAMQFSIKAVQACLQASKDPVDGVRNFMLTVWGDEGAECDYFSSLPILMYTSLQAYSPDPEVDVTTYEAHFGTHPLRTLTNRPAGVCGGNLQAWYRASQIDELPFDNEFKSLAAVQAELPPTQFPPNTSKHLLWEDPFYAVFSPTYAELDLETHYAQLSALLHTDERGLYPLDHHLRLPAYLAKALALKVNLRRVLVDLYRSGQRQELRRFAQQRIGDLRSALITLWTYHRSLWHGCNKPFGWEVLELRYGGLLARVDTLASRISDYCDYPRKLRHQPSLPDPDSMEIDLDEQRGGRAVTARSPTPQLAVWPDHSVYPNGELNVSLTSIPEFEVEALTPFNPACHNLIIEYSRASSVSRLG